jgi:AbrB family looped-hinge helix DNA binding protein
MDLAATLTSKGQITVPKPVRDALGLTDGDRVLFRVIDGCAVIARIPDFLDLAGTIPVPPDLTGADWATIEHLADDATRDEWT